MRQAACAAFLAVVLLLRWGKAAPQAHVGYRTSVCGVGSRALWERTRWCNGLTADLLFLRARNADVGLGAHAEVSTAGFWDARWGAGGTLLLPVTLDYPLVLSFGAYAHELDALALGTSAFFGARSFNFHGVYNLSAGLFVAAYRDLGPEPVSLITLGLELDGFFLVAPLLFALGELR